MKLTEELWNAFGFVPYQTETFGLTRKHKVFTDIYFYKNVLTKIGDPNQRTDMPDTVEVLVKALENYWYRKGQEVGKESAQTDIRQALGIED